MKKFRQKNFIAPLIGVAGKAAMSMAPDLLNAGANAIANKQNADLQKEAMEKQVKMQKEQNKILNKAVKQNPVAVASTIQQQQSQQPQQTQFSYLGNLGKKYKNQAKKLLHDTVTDLNGVKLDDVKGFGKDVKHAFSKNKDLLTKGVLLSGACMAGSYLGNKAIKAYKDKKFKEKVKEWEEEEKNYSVKDSIKRIARHVGRVAKDNKGRLAFAFGSSALAAAAPFAISEYTKRQMAKNTREEEPEEREYSLKFDKKNTIVKAYRNVKAGIKKKYRTIKNDPVRSVLNVVSPAKESELHKVADDLSSGGSGSKITKAVVNTFKNHPKTSLILGGLGVAAINKGVRKLKDGVHKGIKKLDPNAFSQESYYDYLDED